MQFRILGPLEVEDDGNPLPIRGAKQRTLLASLLLHAGETVSRDRLIDELWGERAPESAGHRLEEHVSQLRKVLHRNGEKLVVTRPGGYLLRLTGESLDVAKFQRLMEEGRDALGQGRLDETAALLREALALWRGRPAEDVTLDGIAWPEVGRLEELRAAAAEQLMDAELARGRHAEVVDELESLVRADPLRERLRLQLMLALYRSGRQAESLAAYHDARRTLAEKLSIEPGRALKELEQAILRQDPTLDLFPPGERPLPPLPSASIGNLPRPATSLVGREHEIDEIVAQLGTGSRFVTLTGPGGSGKTRLALEAAYRAAADFPDGVFWIALAPLRDAALVLDSVAQTLGAHGDVARYIGDRRLLLLVDNFEQVSDAAPELASLLVACPNLQILVTSRELLRVGAETEYEVLPLTDLEAVELFCVRGRAQPDEAVAELCRRLDNLPLAIEFAAARTTVLSLRQILERISQRLDLFRGARDTESRQRTLRATIEWSHEFLSDDEQRLFARLAVFAGGWTLEAAEEVARADLDTLQSLVEKSLLQHEGERFSMLETTREFALEQLKEQDRDAESRSHFDYFLRMADTVCLPDHPPEGWFTVIELERDNLRSALAWAYQSDEPERGLLLAIAMWRFWHFSMAGREGIAWLERGLSLSPAPLAEHRAAALRRAARLATEVGDDARSVTLHKEALSMYERSGESEQVAWGLVDLAIPLCRRGDFGQARRALEHALAYLEQADDEGGRLHALTSLGEVELTAGQYTKAERVLETSLSLARAQRNTDKEALILQALGDAALLRGDLARCARRYEKTLPLVLKKNYARHLCECMGGIAGLAAARGDDMSAGRLWGFVEEFEATHGPIVPSARSRYERQFEQVNRHRFAEAVAEGRAFDRSEALAVARAAVQSGSLRRDSKSADHERRLNRF